jgi:hypothetical protein
MLLGFSLTNSCYFSSSIFLPFYVRTSFNTSLVHINNVCAEASMLRIFHYITSKHQRRMTHQLCRSTSYCHFYFLNDFGPAPSNDLERTSIALGANLLNLSSHILNHSPYSTLFRKLERTQKLTESRTDYCLLRVLACSTNTVCLHRCVCLPHFTR